MNHGNQGMKPWEPRYEVMGTKVLNYVNQGLKSRLEINVGNHGNQGMKP